MIYKVLSENQTVVGLGISEPSTSSTVSSVKVSFKTTSFSASFMSFFGSSVDLSSWHRQEKETKEELSKIAAKAQKDQPFQKR